MAFLRHSDQCLIPSLNIAFCFTNLSRLVLEIFRFLEKHAQNLNNPQNNSASWALQIGFNLAFKGLNILYPDTVGMVNCATFVQHCIRLIGVSTGLRPRIFSEHSQYSSRQSFNQVLCFILQRLILNHE